MVASNSSGLRGAYATDTPNQTVLLYSGALTLELSGRTFEATGDVRFAWRPFPGPEAHVVYSPDPDGSPRRGGQTAHVSAGNSRASALLLQATPTRQASAPFISVSAKLRLDSTDVGSNEADIKRLCAHVVNFASYLGIVVGDENHRWPGRLELEADGWRVTVDAVGSLDQILEALDDQGGYAITHVAEVVRTDGAAFSWAQAKDVLEALYLLLSFAKGRSVPLVLPIGYRDSGEVSCCRWGVPSADTWRRTSTWFDRQRPETLSALFPPLMKNWQDLPWRKALQLALYWYMLAIENSAVADASLVLAQTGLELVAWFWLVEVRKDYLPKTFNKMSAHERVHALLSAADVPVDVPPTLPTLLALVVSSKWEDGPHAIAKLRNACVHPNRRAEVFEAPEQARYEAADLGLWYLELSILRMLEFSGVYVNRLARKTSFGAEEMPWSSNRQQ